jgi:poly(hydroxyalkanoate) granule-associated protein
MASTTPPSSEDKEGTPPRSPGGLFDSDLAGTVKQSAQQIWLAGLGAFAKAQEEGSKVFEALVREGTSLQRRTQRPAEERPADAGDHPPGTGSGFASQATQQWDRLESIFEDRVAKALHRLGVPSLKAMVALEARVDELAAEVARLSGSQSAPPADIAAGTPPGPGSEAR